HPPPSPARGLPVCTGPDFRKTFSKLSRKDFFFSVFLFQLLAARCQPTVQKMMFGSEGQAFAKCLLSHTLLRSNARLRWRASAAGRSAPRSTAESCAPRGMRSRAASIRVEGGGLGIRGGHPSHGRRRAAGAGPHMLPDGGHTLR